MPAQVPKTGTREGSESLVEPVETHEPCECGRLPARYHEAVETLHLLGLANLEHDRTEPAQHRCVLAKVPLHGENTDPERLHRGKW